MGEEASSVEPNKNIKCRAQAKGGPYEGPFCLCPLAYMASKKALRMALYIIYIVLYIVEMGHTKARLECGGQCMYVCMYQSAFFCLKFGLECANTKKTVCRFESDTCMHTKDAYARTNV